MTQLTKLKNTQKGNCVLNQSSFNTPVNKPLKLIKPQKAKVPLEFNKELLFVENNVNYGFARGTNIGHNVSSKAMRRLCASPQQ